MKLIGILFSIRMTITTGESEIWTVPGAEVWLLRNAPRFDSDKKSAIDTADKLMTQLHLIQSLQYWYNYKVS